MSEPLDLTAAIKAGAKAIDGAADDHEREEIVRLDSFSEYYGLYGVYADDASSLARAAIEAAAPAFERAVLNAAADKLWRRAEVSINDTWRWHMKAAAHIIAPEPTEDEMRRSLAGLLSFNAVSFSFSVVLPSRARTANDQAEARAYRRRTPARLVGLARLRHRQAPLRGVP